VVRRPERKTRSVFGFIVADGGDEHFFHATDVIGQAGAGGDRGRSSRFAIAMLKRRDGPSVPDQVFGDRRLGDLEAELQQFTLDARGAPQWVLVCTEHLDSTIVVMKSA
jgi:hypothetical protein